MACAGFLLLTLAVLNSIGSSQTFVKIHCKTQNVGQCEQESRLDCVIHYVEDIEDIEDVEIVVVIWRKEGVEEPVLKYTHGELTSLPGYSFAEPSWNNKNVNVSLLIHKTAVKDEGDYTCYVSTDSGYNTNHTRLNVTAKYGVPTIQPQPQDIDLNTDGSLTCRSTGYPKGRLSWFDKDNKPWLEQPEVEVLTTESGLFILSSTLNIQRGSAFSQYTCKVFNARGDEEAEKSFISGGSSQSHAESLHHIRASVEIHCKTQNVGQCDQESRLDCVIHYVEDLEDAEIVAIIWWKEGVEEPVLKYTHGELTSLPGYSFAEPSWNNKNVNVSLLIHKTAVKDEGDYTCDVSTDSGDNKNQTRLNVTGEL
ncbi:titin-like isoform X2 [Labrus mixtus]|uniref:titin-like isoform X2 n=1 Tax=Labrus mixtus TaxID=508554 RepID=UPI0029C031E6|nr:titin-like isoform X2 [Labrus mixtus]